MFLVLFVSLPIGSMLLIASLGLRLLLMLRIPYNLRMIDKTIEKIQDFSIQLPDVVQSRRMIVKAKYQEYLDKSGIK